MEGSRVAAVTPLTFFVIGIKNSQDFSTAGEKLVDVSPFYHLVVIL